MAGASTAPTCDSGTTCSRERLDEIDTGYAKKEAFPLSGLL
jgi:hypothetical protein